MKSGVTKKRLAAWKEMLRGLGLMAKGPAGFIDISASDIGTAATLMNGSKTMPVPFWAKNTAAIRVTSGRYKPTIVITRHDILDAASLGYGPHRKFLRDLIVNEWQRQHQRGR